MRKCIILLAVVVLAVISCPAAAENSAVPPEDLLAGLRDLASAGGAVLRDAVAAVLPVETGPRGYRIAVLDQDRNGVPGAYVNFCSDLQGTCVLNPTDEAGELFYDSVPEEAYHVQLLTLPAGYSFDGPTEAYTPEAFPPSGYAVEFIVHKD